MTDGTDNASGTYRPVLDQPDHPHFARDLHLYGTGRKRILALDGGGIRGLITLGILTRIEEVLARSSPDPENFNLAQYFDLIAGTSTGSIIATALAMGWKVEKVKRLYEDLGPALFPSSQVKGILKFRRSAEVLSEVLHSELSDMTLDSPDLKTGLMICAKRIDTDSAWVLTNNPRAKFWESGGSWLANKDYEVAMLVRASAAAPTYFEPVKITISDGKKGDYEEGLFVDGAISGHNNPAVQSILTATLPSYGLNWARGADNLLVINVGTGWYRERKNLKSFMGKIPALQALDSLKGIINDTVRNDLLLLQAISHPAKPWTINSEVSNLNTELASEAPLISYQRYDAHIDRERFLDALNMYDDKFTDRARDLAFKRVMQMDNGARTNINNCYNVGLKAGEEVDLAHFPEDFNTDFLNLMEQLK
ncbi:MAG: patatin [Ponticaulis sp.]|nr:patatin [Ponticaulis sp.]|tara:strand:+ start:4050 stop:5318 length:1269 start_codon:yes stop_codon:yes gene_type:complete